LIHLSPGTGWSRADPALPGRRHRPGRLDRDPAGCHHRDRALGHLRPHPLTVWC